MEFGIEQIQFRIAFSGFALQAKDDESQGPWSDIFKNLGFLDRREQLFGLFNTLHLVSLDHRKRGGIYRGDVFLEPFNTVTPKDEP